MTLEKTLKAAAYKVWAELEPILDSNFYKIFEVREEALTTMAIKEICRSGCSQISKIEMIPGSEETLKGYDFELVIGSKRKGKYVRFFIQAKRLYGKSVGKNYNAIEFDQTEKLLQYSRREASLAVYAFYNHLLEKDIELNNHYNSATAFDRNSMGITLCSAYSVKAKKSKKFSDYHYNRGYRINPLVYSLRHYPHLFHFYNHSKSYLSIPFHELSYFTIELAENLNQLYKKAKTEGFLHFFFLIGPTIGESFGDSEELIPILNTNIEELVSDFRTRYFGDANRENIYNPQSLIILDTDEVDV